MGMPRTNFCGSLGAQDIDTLYNGGAGVVNAIYEGLEYWGGVSGSLAAVGLHMCVPHLELDHGVHRRLGFPIVALLLQTCARFAWMQSALIRVNTSLRGTWALGDGPLRLNNGRDCPGPGCTA